MPNWCDSSLRILCGSEERATELERILTGTEEITPSILPPVKKELESLLRRLPERSEAWELVKSITDRWENFEKLDAVEKEVTLWSCKWGFSDAVVDREGREVTISGSTPWNFPERFALIVSGLPGVELVAGHSYEPGMCFSELFLFLRGNWLFYLQVSPCILELQEFPFPRKLSGKLSGALEKLIEKTPLRAFSGAITKSFFLTVGVSHGEEYYEETVPADQLLAGLLIEKAHVEGENYTLKLREDFKVKIWSHHRLFPVEPLIIRIVREYLNAGFRLKKNAVRICLSAGWHRTASWLRMRGALDLEGVL